MAANGVARTLYLHVGSNKAGTTSIQHQLRRLVEPEIGVMTVKAFGTPNATRLAAACGGEESHLYFVEQHRIMTEQEFADNARNIWKEAQREILATSCANFVASSEFIGGFVRGRDIAHLKAKLDILFDRVEIIFYLREQFGYFHSFWAQLVKGPSKSIETFDSFLENIEVIKHYWDYETLLKGWCHVFGEDAIKVTVFDPIALHGGDVVADFFHKIGLDHLPIQTEQDSRKNVTPGREELERIRRKNLTRRNLGLTGKDNSGSAGRSLSQDEYRALVLKHVSAPNHWVNEVMLRDRSSIRLPVHE